MLVILTGNRGLAECSAPMKRIQGLGELSTNSLAGVILQLPRASCPTTLPVSNFLGQPVHGFLGGTRNALGRARHTLPPEVDARLPNPPNRIEQNERTRAELVFQRVRRLRLCEYSNYVPTDNLKLFKRTPTPRQSPKCGLDPPISRQRVQRSAQARA